MPTATYTVNAKLPSHGQRGCGRNGAKTRGSRRLPLAPLARSWPRVLQFAHTEDGCSFVFGEPAPDPVRFSDGQGVRSALGDDGAPLAHGFGVGDAGASFVPCFV